MATLRDDVLTAVRHELPERVPAFVEGFDDEEAIQRALGVDSTQDVLDHLGVSVREVITPLSEVYVGSTAQNDQGYHLDPFGVPFSFSYADGVTVRPLAGVETVAGVEAYPVITPDVLLFWDWRADDECF